MYLVVLNNDFSVFSFDHYDTYGSIEEVDYLIDKLKTI